MIHTHSMHRAKDRSILTQGLTIVYITHDMHTHSMHRAKVRSILTQGLRGHERTDVEFRMRTVSGGHVHLLCNATCQKDERGADVIGVVCVGQLWSDVVSGVCVYVCVCVCWCVCSCYRRRVCRSVMVRCSVGCVCIYIYIYIYIDVLVYEFVL